MNILFLDQYAQLGGGQKVLLSIAARLKSRHYCTVALPEKGPLTNELIRLEVPYLTLPMGYYSLGTKTLLDALSYAARLPLLTARLQRIIRDEKINLVYANGARTFVWATRACERTRTPLIWHVHSIFDHGATRRACIRYGSREIVKRIIAVSHAAAAPLSPLRDKISVVHNAVDTDVFFPARSKDTPARRGIAGSRRQLITMACLLMPWKGIEDFIHAAAVVTRGYPHAVFAVVGDVLYDRSGSRYRARLIKLVQDLGLRDNVVFTGFRQDVAQIMRASDIFVLASRKPDPCPTALLQAMGCATAVIATDFGGPAEIIADGKDGILYPAGNPDRLASAITRLLETDQLRERIALAAADKIRREYNQETYLNTITDIVEVSLG